MAAKTERGEKLGIKELVAMGVGGGLLVAGYVGTMALYAYTFLARRVWPWCWLRKTGLERMISGSLCI